MVAPMAILAFLGIASWIVNAPWYHGFTNILGSLGAVHESIHLEIALLGFGSPILIISGILFGQWLGTLISVISIKMLH